MTASAIPDLDAIRLESGGHTSRADGVCVMELAAWIAGREHTDRPPCVSPAIGSFLRSWNDSLADEPRQMLKPYAAKVLNTATTKADEEARAWMATDWLAREFAPAFLRLAGLIEHAEKLERLAALANDKSARAAQPTIDAAESAARSAARSAAESAAESAADQALAERPFSA